MFSTFGVETAKKFTKDELESALAKLSDEQKAIATEKGWILE